ncbi:MAG: trigger factor, partial [Candidatus Margulisiibacteriota bacterium]
MQILSQKRDGNRVSLEIQEEYAAFEKAVEKAIAEASRDVSIPGFRPGKAPKEMIEKVLSRDAVEGHAAQDLISSLYSHVIEEAKVDPVDYPSVEVTRQEKGQPFVFKITVDVYPEVKLGKYKGVKLEKKEVSVSEEEVLKILGNLQDRFTKPGPDGKKELLPLDDEFAKKVSSYGTLAELKNEIQTMLQKEREAEVEAEIKNNAVSAAAAEATVELPLAMVQREIDIMLDELRMSLSQNNLTLEDYLKGMKKEEKALREELQKSAQIRAKGKVVLKAIAEEEKLSVSPQEIDE